jgi:hypothetical protein
MDVLLHLIGLVWPSAFHSCYLVEAYKVKLDSDARKKVLGSHERVEQRRKNKYKKAKKNLLDITNSAYSVSEAEKAFNQKFVGQQQK